MRRWSELFARMFRTERLNPSKIRHCVANAPSLRWMDLS